MYTKMKTPLKLLTLVGVVSFALYGQASAATVDACLSTAANYDPVGRIMLNQTYHTGQYYTDTSGTVDQTYYVTINKSGDSCSINLWGSKSEVGKTVQATATGSATTFDDGTDSGGDTADTSSNVTYNEAGTTVELNENDGIGTLITNVADGEIAEGGQDAVNGGQLYATNQAVTANAGLAQQGVDDAANALTVATEAAEAGENSVQYDDGRTSVTLDENDGVGTTLHNIAGGELSETSLDAINGSQLFATNQGVAANGEAITANAGSIADNTAGISSNAEAILANTDLAQQGVTDAGAAQMVADEALAVAQAAGGMAENAVQFTDDGTAVTLGSNEGAGTTIDNVADGEVSETSMQAVNGSQLWDTNQSVAEALEAAQSAAEMAGAAQLASDNGAQYDDETGSTMSLNNNDGDGTNLKNVADGELFEGSLDAVNAGQLWETNEAVAANAAGVAQNAEGVAHNFGLIGENRDLIGENRNLVGENRDLIGVNATGVAQNAEGVAHNLGLIDENRDLIGVNATGVAQNADAIAGVRDFAGQNREMIGVNAAGVAQNAEGVAHNFGLIGENRDLIGENRGLIGVAQSTADTALALGQNSAQYGAEGNLVLRTDENGNPVSRIQNVADGQLGTDAVNLRQMNGGDARTLHSANVRMTEHVRGREQIIRQDMVRHADQGDAHTLRQANEFAATAVAAMSAVPTVRIEHGKKQGVGIGTAYIDNEFAVGFGYSRKVSHKPGVQGQFDLGLGLSENGLAGANAGYSFSW